MEHKCPLYQIDILRTVGETGCGAALRGCTVFLFSGESRRFYADFFCIRDMDDDDSDALDRDFIMQEA